MNSAIQFQFGLALLILAISGCANTPKTSGTTSATERLASIDVGDVLQGLHPTWVSPIVSRGYPPLQWEHINKPDGLGSLLHEQQLQLGGYMSPGGVKVDLVSTLFQYADESDAAGVPMKSGVDIVLAIIGRTPNAPSIEQIQKGAPSSLPRWFYLLVNPQTGKLYQSFDGSIQEPGGVIFRKLADAETTAQAYKARYGAVLVNQSQYTSGWEITVMSAKPGEVLDSAVIMTRPSQESAAEAAG